MHKNDNKITLQKTLLLNYLELLAIYNFLFEASEKLLGNQSYFKRQCL